MIISWSDKIPHGGGLRSQFQHVNDIAPTIYEAVQMITPDRRSRVKSRYQELLMLRLPHLLCMCLLIAPNAIHAESKNPADYPLRIHIFGRSETTFYHNRSLDESKGDGRANIFENSEARGVDFSFDCPEKIRASFGFETYPAKWKKPNQELTVLFPVFGKANTYFTCNLKAEIKDYAYASHEGRMTSEPTAQFKAWMVKHDYDPEHGKNTPTRTEPANAPPTAAHP